MFGGNFRLLLIAFAFIPIGVHADILPLYDALRATYTACVGIDDELADLKKMAGINTAVTAVGTAAGASATVVGLVKASTDSKASKLEEILKELAEKESKHTRAEQTRQEKDQYYQDFLVELEKVRQDKSKYQSELDKLNKKSKRLGNWRTGLIAGSTVTNVAGAIIASANKVDKDLQTQIDNCRASVTALRQSMMQARIDGEDVTEAKEIIAACGEYDYVDVSKINNHAKGAMISSIVGATTGTAGTVTSAIANTDKTRNDNTDAGKQKEKNLNTVANVLSGATTVASGTATVFNAMQISAIKKVAVVAEKCTGVLK